MPCESIKLCYTVTQRTISINNPDLWFWTTELCPQGKAPAHPKGTKCTWIQPCQGTTWPENRTELRYISFDRKRLICTTVLRDPEVDSWFLKKVSTIGKQENSLITRQFTTTHTILELWMLSPILWRSGFTSECTLLCLQSLLRQPLWCCH